MKIAAVLLVCLVLQGSARDRVDQRFLKSINNLMAGKLCAAPLRFPVRLDARAPQYWFEEAMRRSGVLRVISLRQSVPTVDVAAAFRRWTRTRVELPGYRSICYGGVRATRIEGVTESGDRIFTVNFHYTTFLEPWASALAPHLRMPREGDSVITFSEQTGGVTPLLPPTNIVNFRVTQFPPDGKNWYPHGMPGALLPRHLRV